MILFLGDSFTWGQGLEWEYAIENNLMTIDEINKIIPPKFECERLPFEFSEYRKRNRFASLVAKHFDTSYEVGRYGNGGSNENIKFILENLEQFIHLEHLDLIILQFTDISRNTFSKSFDFNINFNEYQENYIMEIVNILDQLKLKNKINYSCLSYKSDPACILLKNKPDCFIKLIHNDNQFLCFEDIPQFYLSKKYDSLEDYHFSKEGNNIISNSIIKHIVEKKYLQKKLI